MSTAKKKTKLPTATASEAENPTRPTGDDPDAVHVVASLARVRDPMMRYLVTMLIDRLTQGISALEKGESQREGSLDTAWTGPRDKPN